MSYKLKDFCDLAIKVAENCQDADQTELGQALRESHEYIGIATAETNEHSLSSFHKQKWLDILLERRTLDGEDVVDYELGYAYNEIGVAYTNDNRLEDAATAFLRSIEIFQGLPDYDDTWLSWPEPNLGFVYWLQGRYSDAESVLEEILGIHEAAYGKDDTKSFK